MDIDAIAKKAQERIFARAEEDGCHRGKVMHASAVQEEIARTIREAMPTPSWYGGVVAVDRRPGAITWLPGGVMVAEGFAQTIDNLDLSPGTICGAPKVDDEYR